MAEWAGELASVNRSPMTIEGYLIDLRQYLQWLRGHDPLGDSEADAPRSGILLSEVDPVPWRVNPLNVYLLSPPPLSSGSSLRRL